ncbi:MAG: hypothetical protein ACI9U2_001060 [Bradymonadia bacterium]|jgi:hypothetical protein
MFTLLVSALVLAAPVLAAPAAVVPPTPAPAKPVLAPPSDSDSLQKLFDQGGCRWGSAASVLCLEVDVEMGFATLALAFYSVSKPTPGKPTQRFVLYRDGNTDFDATKVDTAAWDAAMHRMGKSTFTPGTREKVALPKGYIALPGVRWAQPKPIWNGAQARKCCRWTALQATRFAQSAAVRLGLDCDYTGDDAKKATDACYINGYNEESLDRRQFIMLGRAPTKR